MPSNTFDELVDNFIQNEKREKGERTHETYGRKVLVFKEYLELNGTTDQNFRPRLLQIDIIGIVSSLRYYVETCNIKFKSTADTYFAAITVFFKYIDLVEGIRNENFQLENKYREMKVCYGELIKEKKLRISEQFGPLSESECNRLISACNRYLDSSTEDDIINGDNNGIYTNFISSLICKFVLVFGTKNKCLSELAISDLDDNLNKISINGFNVHMPDMLSLQMKKYIRIRDVIISGDKKEDRLFIDIHGDSELDNARMFTVVKGITGNSSAMSIAKYAIIQMLKNGVSVNVVQEFTGYSDIVTGHCQEILDDENGIFKHSDKVRRVDAGLRQSRMFDNM